MTWAENARSSETDSRLGSGRTLDPELRVQHPDVALDLADRQHELLGDLLVAGREGERGAILVRTAQRDQYAALGRGQAHRARRRRRIVVRRARRRSALFGCGRSSLSRGAIGHGGSPESHDVPVGQAMSAADALLVDIGAVARDSVVDQHPVFLRFAVEPRVQARDPTVPGEREIRGGAPSDGGGCRAGVEEEQLLPAVAVPEHEKRAARALCVGDSLSIGGRLADYVTFLRHRGSLSPLGFEADGRRPGTGNRGKATGQDPEC